MTDISVSSLGDNCKQLEQLDICRCALVGDPGVCSLGAGCHLLRGLVLSHCKGVTDVGIESLANGCPNLEELNLFQTAISEKGLFALRDRCRYMKKLNITGCFKVSQKGTDAVRHWLPHMKELRGKAWQAAKEEMRLEEIEAEAAAAEAAAKAEAIAAAKAKLGKQSMAGLASKRHKAIAAAAKEE